MNFRGLEYYIIFVNTTILSSREEDGRAFSWQQLSE
jgi:hypothetical protein